MLKEQGIYRLPGGIKVRAVEVHNIDDITDPHMFYLVEHTNDNPQILYGVPEDGKIYELDSSGGPMPTPTDMTVDDLQFVKDK